MPAHSHSFPSTSSQNLFSQDFHSLSVHDLLDARDQFHVHLAKKPNVFSTAIGRYLIRSAEAKDKDAVHPRAERPRKAKPRTLATSSVQEFSWPCILVFVNRWQTLDDLHKHPEYVIPPFVSALFLASISGSFKLNLTEHRGLIGQISPIITTTANVFVVPLIAVLTALLYLKARQAGGETLREAMSQFEEEDIPRTRWQMRMRERLTLPTQTGR